MKKTAFFIASSVLVAMVSGLLPAPARAALTFNPNSIISDEDFFKPDDMTADEVQRFLERKESSLATYRVQDVDGVVRPASYIIWGAAERYSLNPKVLLVLLQKEQSLIENPNPSQYNYDWATGFARCDSCSVNDPRVAGAKGFVTQVDRAAWRKHYYITNPQEFQFRVGQSKAVDGIDVVPENNATMALYNYTPHLKGNFSFWKLWNKYFGKAYPDGTVVQNHDSPDIWLIQQGKRRKFSSLGVFLSRSSKNQIIPIAAQDLLKYEVGDPIKFAQYSLLKSPRGTIYLYYNDTKYGIASRNIFRNIGFNPDEVVKASKEDLDAIREGDPITSADTNPSGDLMQDTKNGGIYYVQGAVKHPLLERALLTTNFPYRKIAKKKQRDLEKYETGDPALFADGTLVTAPDAGAIYLISNGAKRPFASKTAFDTLGFQWSQIVRSNGKTLTLHANGEPIDLGVPLDQEIPSPLIAATITQ